MCCLPSVSSQDLFPRIMYKLVWFFALHIEDSSNFLCLSSCRFQFPVLTAAPLLDLWSVLCNFYWSVSPAVMRIVVRKRLPMTTHGLCVSVHLRSMMRSSLWSKCTRNGLHATLRRRRNLRCPRSIVSWGRTCSSTSLLLVISLSCAIVPVPVPLSLTHLFLRLSLLLTPFIQHSLHP